jgi:hypothetical protein
MEYLFDANKPHIKVRLTPYDIGPKPGGDAIFFWFALDEKEIPRGSLILCSTLWIP